MALPNELLISSESERDYLYVVLNGNNMLIKQDLETGDTLWITNPGVAPYGLTMAGGKIYVTNWAGRHPLPDDPDVAGVPWGSARVNNKAGVLQICGSIPKPLRTQLPGESDETLRRKFQALRKDDRLKQYDEAQCAAFGADWIKRLGEGELTFDPKAPFTHGLPSIMPTGKVEG